MDANEYQDFTMDMWTRNDDDIIRCVLGVNGEAGEVAELYKKAFRKGDLPDTERVIDELGDVLYYIARLSGFLGYDLTEVMSLNMIKLRARHG